MSDANPYQPPEQTGSTVRPPARFSELLTAGGFALGSSLFCGLAGMAIGAAIGALMPGYYRTVFSNGHEPYFDPISVGMGLGLTQGIGAGLFGGIALAAAWWWFRSRPARAAMRADVVPN